MEPYRVAATLRSTCRSSLWWLAVGAMLNAACAPADADAVGASSLSPASVSENAAALTVDPPVVVSQVFGGGSNTGALWQNDFVELFNRTAAQVTLDGWSVQYASATGTGLFSSAVTALAGTIQPGQYYLVRLAGGTTNGAPLPAADAVGTTSMSATAGKVALVRQSAGLACNGGASPCSEAALAQIVDLVGYGSANFFETTATPALTNTTAAVRAGDGCIDTNNNAADFVLAPPAPRNTASVPAVCGGDTAPFVAATTPINGSVDASPDASVVITFSEPVALDPGALSISCTVSGNLTLATTGGPLAFTLTSPAPLTLGESCTVTVSALAVHDLDSVDPPDVMDADYMGMFTVVSGPGAYRIHDVQGHAHLSPLVGQTVGALPGIVTVLASNGFYMQDPQPDDDEATSEGIFVYTGTAPTVQVSDDVLVSGPVAEYRPSCASCSPSSSAYSNLTTTEINRPSSIAVLAHGQALPPPVSIGPELGDRHPPTRIIDDDSGGNVESPSAVFDPVSDGIDFYESLEGMRVSVSNAVVIGPTALLAGGGRELPVLAADGAGATSRTARGGIIITSGDNNPERLILASTPLHSLPDANVGDRLPGITTGVIDYSSGNFKLLLSEELPALTPGGLTREATSLGEATPAQLSIATLNCENLDPTDGAEKFAALAAILVNNLAAPDLVALEEIQDNDGATNDGVVDASLTLGTLLDAVVAAGGPRYEYRQIDPADRADGGESGGNIRQAILFRGDRGLTFADKPGAVFDTPNEVVAADGMPSLRFSPGRIDPTNAAFDNSRKPLAAEFRYNGRSLFVIANHFNSKGGDQPLFGRFQPPTLSSETQRLAQAQVVATFVGQLRAIDPRALVVVLGDLNDFEFSAPLAILQEAGLTPLVTILPAPERYTYVYEGNSQTLDHILVSPALLDTAAFDIVHVNAEFSQKASDHDPLVARLTIGTPATFTSLPVTTAVLGEAYAYQAAAQGQPAPTYALDAAPDGMAIDAATGVITWTPTGLAGSYAVAVRAANGVSPAALQSFAIVAARPGTVQPVQPIVECVEWSPNGGRIARLGYNNPNRFAVQIPSGWSNGFVPTPLDRGQPTVFSPGRVNSVWRVPLPRLGLLVWVLDLRLAIATASPMQRCP